MALMSSSDEEPCLAMSDGPDECRLASSPRSSSESFLNMEMGDGDHMDVPVTDHEKDLPMSECFRWAVHGLHVLQLAIGTSSLQKSLASERICLSTTCSGIGAPEMAARFLQAASKAIWHAPLHIIATAACEISRDCRRILQIREPTACLHRDIYETTPFGWDRDVTAPAAAMTFSTSGTTGSRRRCFTHEQDYTSNWDQNSRTLKVAGTRCPPWSRRGKRGGLSDSRSSVMYAWLGELLCLQVPFAVHETVRGFPRLGLGYDSFPACQVRVVGFLDERPPSFFLPSSSSSADITCQLVIAVRLAGLHLWPASAVC